MSDPTLISPHHSPPTWTVVCVALLLSLFHLGKYAVPLLLSAMKQFERRKELDEYYEAGGVKPRRTWKWK